MHLKSKKESQPGTKQNLIITNPIIGINLARVHHKIIPKPRSLKSGAGIPTNPATQPDQHPGACGEAPIIQVKIWARRAIKSETGSAIRAGRPNIWRRPPATEREVAKAQGISGG